MNKIIEFIENEKNNHWLILTLGVVAVILAIIVSKKLPILSLVFIFGAFISFKYANIIMKKNNSERYIDSSIANLVPENWSYGIIDNEITIIRDDRQMFKISRGNPHKNTRVDIIWKENLINSNLAFDMLNYKKKSSLIDTTYKFFTKQNQHQPLEFKGNAEELINYVAEL